MSNDHLMYHSDSVKCDIKVEFEDWESKFTPGVSMIPVLAACKHHIHAY